MAAVETTPRADGREELDMPAMTISESPGMGAILAQQDEIPDGPDVRGDRKAKVGLFSAVTAHYAHVLCCLCDGLAAPVAKIIRKGPRADMRYRDGVACWLQAPARSRHGAGWRRVYNPPSCPFSHDGVNVGYKHGVCLDLQPSHPPFVFRIALCSACSRRRGRTTASTR